MAFMGRGGRLVLVGDIAFGLAPYSGQSAEAYINALLEGFGATFTISDTCTSASCPAVPAIPLTSGQSSLCVLDPTCLVAGSATTWLFCPYAADERVGAGDVVLVTDSSVFNDQNSAGTQNGCAMANTAFITDLATAPPPASTTGSQTASSSSSGSSARLTTSFSSSSSSSSSSSGSRSPRSSTAGSKGTTGGSRTTSGGDGTSGSTGAPPAGECAACADNSSCPADLDLCVQLGGETGGNCSVPCAGPGDTSCGSGYECHEFSSGSESAYGCWPVSGACPG